MIAQSAKHESWIEVENAPAASPRQPPEATSATVAAHSHSMVPGGFGVVSYITRVTPSTSAMIRNVILRSRS